MDSAIAYRDAIQRHFFKKRGRHPVIPGMYTQIELASRAGLPRSTVAAILGGGECLVSTLEKMLEALGYDLVAVPRQTTEQATSSSASS